MWAAQLFLAGGTACFAFEAALRHVLFVDLHLALHFELDQSGALNLVAELLAILGPREPLTVERGLQLLTGETVESEHLFDGAVDVF